MKITRFSEASTVLSLILVLVFVASADAKIGYLSAAGFCLKSYWERD